MRVELYGCPYVAETLSFNGSSMVWKNLTRPWRQSANTYTWDDNPNAQIQSQKDIFRFRFRTTEPDGILMYSRGTQNDFVALQLFHSR